MEQTQVDKKINSITEGVVRKQLLIFFFPLLFGTFFQQLYNTVDAIVVGRFVGKEALSAVGGSTGQLINLFLGFFIGMSSGATVTISQYFGGKNEEKVSDSVHTSIALAIVGGVIIMIIGLLGAPTALRWMGTPDDTMTYSLQYIRIYLLGMIPNLVYNMGSGILRAIGDSKRPLYFLIIGCFTNIILDILFVVVFHWEVIGVAIATVISQLVTAVLVCIVLMKTDESYKLEVKKIKFHDGLLRKIIKIGVPSGFQSLTYSLSNILIQSSINSFGTVTIAAWVASGKIDSVFWMLTAAFGITVTTFVAQNYGAGKNDRVKEGVKTSFIMAVIIAIAISAIIIVAGKPLLGMFTTEKEVADMGMHMLLFLAPFYVTYIPTSILSGSLRGFGDTFIPMIISAVGVCALRVLWVLIIVPISPNIDTVMIGYPITWIFTSVLFIFYFNHFIKKKNIY